MSEDAAKSKDIRTLAVKWFAGASGGGVAAVVSYQLLEMLRSQPALAEKVLGWGPLFIIVLFGGLIFDRRAGQFVEAQQRTAVAIASGSASTQALAASVERLASKDDQRAREQDLVLNHLANTMNGIALGQKTILSEIEEIRKGPRP